jgi:hypothetical protein
MVGTMLPRSWGAWRLPGRNPETGVAMRQELVCECVSLIE